jgi:hypothetical protein
MKPLSGKRLAADIPLLCSNRFSVLTPLEDELPSYSCDLSTAVPRNKFLSSSMNVLGGGEAVLLSKLSIMERRGGGMDDGWKTVNLLDREYLSPCPFTYNVAEQCRFLGVEPGSLRPYDFDSAVRGSVQNLGANPGPTFKALGFDRKRESVALAMDMAREVVDKSSTEPVLGYLKPRYALAGRTKLAESEKFRVKSETLQPFGRAVFMGDQHEALVAARFAVPLLEHLHCEMKVITNGFNKFGDDPKKICDRLSAHNVFINGDFSQFDINCGPKLMARAFDVLRAAFGAIRFSDTQDDRLFDWLEDEIIRSDIVLYTGKVVRKNGGVPSGSGLTALLDSIINAIMWQEILYRAGVSEFALFVHGDDNLVGLTVPKNAFGRREWATNFLYHASRNFLELYDHKLSVEKTTVGTTLYVGFARPRVPCDTQDHSRAVIGRYRKALAAEKGAPLTFSEKFEVLETEPIGPAPGATHRWTYVFNGRAKFLSHYFKRDSSSEAVMCVRPTAEVVANLLYPEGRVRNLKDHLDRLVAAWVENMGNHHVTNRIMHYLYDAMVLEKEGCLKKPPRHHVARRAWYRKVDRVVDLLDEDAEFFTFYRKFEEQARRAHSAAFGGMYASWVAVRALRRGRLRLTIGGPLARDPGPGEYAQLFEKRGFVENLGLLGFNLWAARNLRVEVLNRALAIMAHPVLDYTAGGPLSLKRSILQLRSDYGGDFCHDETN